MDLFSRVGRNLEITEDGRLVLSYADELFSLGGELEETIQQLPEGRSRLFRVGVVDVLPKSIAHLILAHALHWQTRSKRELTSASVTQPDANRLHWR